MKLSAGKSALVYDRLYHKKGKENMRKVFEQAKWIAADRVNTKSSGYISPAVQLRREFELTMASGDKYNARICGLGCYVLYINGKKVGDDVLSRMAAHVGHQGVIARLREASFMTWEDFLIQAASAPLPLIVALDQVQDPGNVGTLARTLFAMGGAGLVLPKHNSAFLGPGARRSAAGALERLPLTQVVNLSRAVKDARDAGFVTCAAQKVEDSIDPLVEKLPLPALLVLGNEEKGVRPGVLKHCDCSLCIPFRRDFDSLNVAQAGAILISCFARSLAL